jgi:hypothetical protein
MSNRRLPVPQRFARAAGRGPCFTWNLRAPPVGALLALSMSLASVPVAAAETCRPVLSIRNAQLSTYKPPVLERKWTALVVADASRCATGAGQFEIAFLREQEASPDLVFREQFTWSAPSTLISVDFSFDEAVVDYWIHGIQPCVCAK